MDQFWSQFWSHFGAILEPILESILELILELILEPILELNGGPNSRLTAAGPEGYLPLALLFWRRCRAAGLFKAIVKSR